MGNYLLLQADAVSDGSKRRRTEGPGHVRQQGLGSLRILSDELVIELLDWLDPRSLACIGGASRALFAFSRHEDLWRQHVLREHGGMFHFRHLWRETYATHAMSGHQHNTLSFWVPASIMSGLHSDLLFQSWLCATHPIRESWLRTDTVERRQNLSVADFISQYEQPNRPVVITDIVRSWPAFTRWSREYLLRMAGEQTFEVGPIEMSLSSYLQYADTAIEESPLYLFDKHFVDKHPSLATDYNVPGYFAEDFFSVLGESERPDYRWLIVGPARSGSAFHVDPNATSAWNACITGSKKWILYPPGHTPPGVHPSKDGSEVTSTVSLMEWFLKFYSATKEGPVRPVEFVAKAGDLVFVPSGWFHLVMNLEESIAITQNFVSRQNMRNVLDLLKNKTHLISGLRSCGKEKQLYDMFCSGFKQIFPGELERLQQQWSENDKRPRLGVSWNKLRTADRENGEPVAEPFMFNFVADDVPDDDLDNK